MRKIICQALALLFPLHGCSDAGMTSTSTLRTVRDGPRNDVSWSKTYAGHARFSCMESSSGRCLVVVFTSDCLDSRCKATVLHDFVLPAGGKKSIGRLPPGFRHCIGHDGRPPVPEGSGDKR